MRRKPAPRRRSRKSSSSKNPNWLLFIIVLILAPVIAYKGLQGTHVLGESTLIAQAPPEGAAPPAQSQPQQQSQPNPAEHHDSPPAQSQPQQQSQSQPQQQAPQQQSQPQSQPQNNPQQQQTNQQQQYQQYQPKNAEEQKQMQQYMQQSPNQQKQTYQQNQQQGSQQYQQQGQSQNGNQQQPQLNQTGQNQKDNQQNSNNFQMTTEQQQQYQKYQQSTPQEQEQMRQQYQKQAQQMQQQWQKQAAQNGFQINTPTIDNKFPTFGTSGQSTGKESGSQNQSIGTLPSLSSFPTIKGQFFVSSANGGSNVNLNDKNTSVVLGSDNSVKVKKADGTEVTINKDALEKINTAIKLETGSEISQNGNAYVMKRGQVEAQTNFPISFNVATRTFSVQTASGTKEVSVLPDQAVEKAIQSGIISNVSGADTTRGTNANSKVQLTEYNNQPAYQVNGDSKQRMFGILPVSIGKTTYISAENGNVITTNQSVFSRFLDAISF